MKYVLLAIISLLVSYLIVVEGYELFKKLLAKRKMINFLKKYQNTFSVLIPSNIISIDEFENLKNTIIELAIDEMPREDIYYCMIFFNSDKDKELQLKEYSNFFIKAGIIKRALHFETSPLERFTLND